MAVAIVVDKSAAGVPALAISGDARIFADVGEGAITVVVVENTFAEVSDEKIVETVVIVVSDTNSLSPTGVEQAGFGGDVGESAIAIVFEEMRRGLLASRKTFEAPAVDEKNVQPAVVVVIIESDAAAGGFEKVFVFVLATEDSFYIQAGLTPDVQEGNTEIVSRRSNGSLRRRHTLRKEWRQPFLRKRQGKHSLQREHNRGTAE